MKKKIKEMIDEFEALSPEEKKDRMSSFLLIFTLYSVAVSAIILSICFIVNMID